MSSMSVIRRGYCFEVYNDILNDIIVQSVISVLVRKYFLTLKDTLITWGEMDAMFIHVKFFRNVYEYDLHEHAHHQLLIV